MNIHYCIYIADLNDHTHKVRRKKNGINDVSSNSERDISRRINALEKDMIPSLLLPPQLEVQTRFFSFDKAASQEGK